MICRRCFFCWQNRPARGETERGETDRYEGQIEPLSDHFSSVHFLPDSSTDVSIHVALFDYKRQRRHDLNLLKGDRLILLEFEKFAWSKVRIIKSQEEGYVPSNYIVPFTDIEDKPYYVGSLSAHEATELLLRGSYENGVFMVRQSGSSTARYSVSVLYNGMVVHYRIRESNGKYSITNNLFPSISELIDNHRSNPLGSQQTKLITPFQMKPPEAADLSLIDPLHEFELEASLIEFHHKIGESRFSEVRKGLLCGQLVAIKTAKDGTEEEYLHEAEIMSQLHHPNLLSLVAVCTQRWPYHIVSELMPHGDLHQHLRTKGVHLRDDQLVNYARQIAAGMKYMEERSCVHRDLTARNVLLGHEDQLKIADFGLSRFENRRRMGTSTMIPVRWTAPEAYSAGNYSVQSDVWSYGVLLFEIFSLGKTPYSEIQTNVQVMEQVKNGHRLERPSRAPTAIYQLMEQTWNLTAELRPSFHNIAKQLDYIDV